MSNKWKDACRLLIQLKFYNGSFMSFFVIKNSVFWACDMFTALFAVARTVGWVSQWKELVEDPS